MSRFADKIESGKFLVTAELEPPKGVDLTKALATADILKDVTDAVNVTDQQASVMRAAPWAICRVLLDRGLEPIMQMTARDRNRIALQSDLLAASILGIENVLCLTGDPTGTGDHPDAKAVFDLNVVAMVEAARSLQDGRDIAGHELQGAPRFCVGAVANPGARFIQTQAVYDLDEFADFIEQTKHLNVAVLAGIILLKSANQARFMNEKIPGIRVPDSLIDEIDGSQDRPATSVEIAARTIRGLQGLCSGVHIMAMGWERHIPAVLRTAGLLAE